ncbi:MAG: hypothetical protein V4649_09305 [Bacteroidota bacterium]
MRKPYYLLFSLLFLVFTKAGAQSFKWVKGGGSNSAVSASTGWKPEATYFTCADANGNIYALSVMGNGIMHADTFYRPGAYGVNANVLFSSYTCSGQMRFAKLISGEKIIPQGVSTDNLGHVYLAMDLPHGSSGITVLRVGYDTTITGFTYSREALIQYDTTGDLHWVRFIGNNTLSSYAGIGGTAHFLAVDGNNNPHLLNYLPSNVVLSTTVTTQGGIYDSEYDQYGNLLSAKKLELDSTLMPVGGTIDKASSKLYVYGHRSFAFPDSSMHPYIAAFDTLRNLIWKDTVRNVLSSGTAGISGVTADEYGSLYILGGGSGPIIYRSDTAKNSFWTTGYSVSFILKTDTAGSAGWLRTYSGTSGVNGFFDLAVLDGSKVAIAGGMTGKIRSGNDSIVSYIGEGQNAFLASLILQEVYLHYSNCMEQGFTMAQSQ